MKMDTRYLSFYLNCRINVKCLLVVFCCDVMMQKCVYNCSPKTFSNSRQSALNVHFLFFSQSSLVLYA